MIASGPHDLGIPDTPVRSAEDFRRRFAAVRARIDAACRAAGRDPAEVRILPVSKTVDEARIRFAVAAGCRAFGENKVQEARRKAHGLSDLGIRWSVIGHLQSNKAKYVARFAHEFQALDSLDLAAQLHRRLQAQGRMLDVYVQVNSSGETSKYGLDPDEVGPFLHQLAPYPLLRVQGLMTLAVFSPDPERVRGCFALMRRLRERLCREAALAEQLQELSMGMSGDFEIAIGEGATVVRIGQALFGTRPLPDSHYWPAGEA